MRTRNGRKGDYVASGQMREDAKEVVLIALGILLGAVLTLVVLGIAA